jgi:hypothetical protein
LRKLNEKENLIGNKVVFWSTGNKSQKPESNVSVEVIDGIEYIHNTETPLHPDKTVTFEIIFEDIS